MQDVKNQTRRHHQKEKVIKVNKNILILMDSNIDLHDQMNRADIKELKEILY